ncbi:MAG: dihydroorotate dehydrogenase electron transfer subunit [Candidatus Diapherotrites archaeon]|nr:dihydroorotate dehydrogenase electron transfer subunit [Candidatus Diapherotrites archaeon]
MNEGAQNSGRLNKPITLPIVKVVDEAKDFKSFYFDFDLDAKPGQFVTVWIPGVNEKPFAVSGQKDGLFSVTVSAVGPFTNKMHELKEGDKVGVKGPYGTHYKISGPDCDGTGAEHKNLVLVAGGYGVAPLVFLAEEAVGKGVQTTMIAGTRTKELLAFREKLESIGVEYLAATDDGSEGFHGFVTDVLENQISQGKASEICACGPRPMLERVGAIAEKHNLPGQFGLESYMKCGFGICGECAVDYKGIHICKDGPVFPLATAMKIFRFKKENDNFSQDNTDDKSEKEVF